MVSWKFIGEALTGYGFPETFIQLVMTCVTTTKFTVKVNGESVGYFEGRRGLKQGDPISPLLFVLVMEYLSRTLKKMSELPDFTYHPMCKDLKLTHLIFADGLMILCKGDIKFIARVMEAISHFSRTGFTIGTLPIKYLRMPLSFKKWSKMECHELMGKITNGVRNAYSRCLSYAGRLQIINVVLFSIYNFWEAVFILPQSVLKEMDKICRDYLWGSTEDHRKLTLVAWDRVCTPKKYGGLNIKGCKNWNIAVVGKLLW
nr:uncharacterized protein LOC104095699 [Nicotiana tomentosiformis]